MSVRSKAAQEIIERRAHQLAPPAPAKGSPFATTGYMSCIKCGTHRPRSQLKYWRGTFYKCSDAEQCK